MTGFWKLEKKYGLYSNVFRESGVFMEMKFKIMKLQTLFISILLIACKSNDINPSDIIGKWGFTGLAQSKNIDGTWSAWRVNEAFCIWWGNDLAYEFTSDGKFLRSGQSGADCCNAGNKYRVANNEIIFSDFLACPTVKCGKPQNWIIIEIKNDTLILEKYSVRSKYVQIK